jgi:hypothetical protein
MRAEAAETKIETTQRSTGRLNAIEEDNDFSVAAEEVDSESEENSHGATDEKPRELYEIRRLTQEDVDRFKKEGKCFICHRRDTSLSTAQTKEPKERQNEDTPAGKVRPESAACGKLQGEVSSPTTTQDEIKTKEVRSPLPQTTLRPFFRSKDFSDMMMNREYFLKYSQTYGPFDLDGASDNDDGLNSQVAEDFRCPARPFQERDLKYRRVWLNAPFNELEDSLGHYLRSKLLHLHPKAVIVVSKWRTKPWFKLLRNYRLVDELAAS